MKPVIIAKGVSITKTRKGNSQRCIVCAQPIGEGNVAISFHNYNDILSMKKNVWLHIKCFSELEKLIKEGIEDNKEILMVESI